MNKKLLCIVCMTLVLLTLCTPIQIEETETIKSTKESTRSSTESKEIETTETPSSTTENSTENNLTSEEIEEILKTPLCLTIDIPLSDDLKNFIYEKCNTDDRLYLLIISIIEQESNFQANVIGVDGHDYGLMQIRDINHQWLQEELGEKDFLDPYDNVECGIYIVKQFWDEYEEENLVLMCYNLGEGGAQQKWNQGVYSTEYTRIILERYEKYKELIYN